MLSKFSEWVRAREARLNEGFTTLSQQPGDMVYFGAHGILGMPDDQQLDPELAGPMLSPITSIGPKGVVVDAPQRHNFRRKSIKKFMSKGGGFTIPPDHLQEISPDMVKGGVGADGEGKPKRLFIFTPNMYTKEMLLKKNKRMMKADAPTPAAVQPQLQLPAPSTPAPATQHQSPSYGDVSTYSQQPRSYGYYNGV